MLRRPMPSLVNYSSKRTIGSAPGECGERGFLGLNGVRTWGSACTRKYLSMAAPPHVIRRIPESQQIDNDFQGKVDSLFHLKRPAR